MRPELADFRSAAPGSSTRTGVSSQNRRSNAMHGRQLQFVEALHRPCRLLPSSAPASGGRRDAMAGEDLRLAIERRAPGEFRRGDMATAPSRPCRSRRAAGAPWPGRRRPRRPGRRIWDGSCVGPKPAGTRSTTSLTSPRQCDASGPRSTGTASSPARSLAQPGADASAERRCCAGPCAASVSAHPTPVGRRWPEAARRALVPNLARAARRR